MTPVLSPCPPLAKQLYPQLDTAQKALFDTIEYIPLIGVHIGLNRRPPNKETVTMFPERESNDAAVAYINHNKAPGRAPDHKGSLSLYFAHHWSSANYELPDDKVTWSTIL